MNPRKPYSTRAFSLIELSVVLIIIAMIVAMGINTGVDVMESAKQSATEKRLNEIEKALFAFRERYDRLPCPARELATNSPFYGREHINWFNDVFGCAINVTGTLAAPSTQDPSDINGDAIISSIARRGPVPTRSLGLPDEYMYDGWGRKFTYQVRGEMTSPDSFDSSPPSDNCNLTRATYTTDNDVVFSSNTASSLTIVNEAGAVVTDGAVYVLWSAGRNGLGALDRNNVRMDMPPNNSDELVNSQSVRNISSESIRNVAPDVTSAQYVIRHSTSGQVGTAAYYDDIIRYKTRMGLMTDDDRKKDWYLGPDFVLSYTDIMNGVAGGGPYVFLGKQKCGAFVPYAGALPTAPAADANIKFFAFTPNNEHLFAYYNGTCHLFHIQGEQLVNVTDDPVVDPAVVGCPVDTGAANVAPIVSGGAIASKSGDLILRFHEAIVGFSGSGQAKVWKLTGNGMNARYVPYSQEGLRDARDNLAVPPLDYGPWPPAYTNISEDGKYITLGSTAGPTATSYGKLYVRKDNKYVEIPANAVAGRYFIPAGLPVVHDGTTATIRYNIISPNGEYYAIIADGQAPDNLRLYLWKNLGKDGFQAIDFYDLGANLAGSPTFSENSEYLAINTLPQFNVFHINPENNVVTQFTGGSGINGGSINPLSNIVTFGTSFSQDAKYLLLGLDTNNAFYSKRFFVLKRHSPDGGRIFTVKNHGVLLGKAGAVTGHAVFAH